jgi:hypothetical protein
VAEGTSWHVRHRRTHSSFLRSFFLFMYLSFYRCYLGGRRDVVARTTQTYSNERLRGSSMKRFLYVSLFSDLFPSFYFLFSFLRAFARFLNEKGWERAEASGYNDSSQRAQKFKRENDGFWYHFLASPWSERMPLILLQVLVMPLILL